MKAVVAHVLLCFLIVYAADIPIRIGSLFAISDSASVLNIEQEQYLSAFLMAIEEINNKTDGIHDSMLPNTRIDIIVKRCVTRADAAQASLDLAASNVTAILSALPDAQAVESAGILTDKNIVEAFSVSTATELGFGWLYPYKVATTPMEAVQGLKVEYLLCKHFNYTRISIFATNDYFGQMATLNVLDGSVCKLNAPSVQFFTPAPITQDFSAFISNALAVQTQVFVIFSDPVTAGLLLEQGYNMGLFRPGTQIIGSQSMLTPALWQAMSPTADVAAILKGFIAFEYSPMYSITEVNGPAFVKRWRAQKSTLGTAGHCSTVTDDSTAHTPLFAHSNGTVCTGLNYSSFAADGSNMAPFVATTYDAACLLAMGIDAVLKAQLPLTTATLDNALLHGGISFMGVSGLVTEYAGTAINWARGSRRVGFHFKIFNFQPSLYYMNQSSGEAFGYAGVFSVTNGVYLCGATVPAPSCYPLVLNNPTSEYAQNDGHFPYVAARAPAVIKIGLMIEQQFDPVTGERNMQSVETLAAVQMAINEINGHIDSLLGSNLLPNSKIVMSVLSSSSAVNAGSDANFLKISSFGDSGFQAVIAAVPNSYLAALTVFSQLPVMNMVTMATDSSLSIGSQFPYKVETLPVDNFEQMVWQDIFCSYYEYAKITLFVSSDVVLTDNGHCGLTILSTHAFLPGTVDFTMEIEAAKVVGARIFAIYTDASTGGRLLEQGHAAGLFGRDTFVIGSSAMASPLLWQTMSAGADVAAILQGFTVATYWPTYAIDTQEIVAIDFVNRWRSQQSTIFKNGNKTTCNHTQDDNMAFYLYHEQLVPGRVTLQTARCSGLDFASYSKNGSDMQPFTAHAYDAVYSIAAALTSVLASNASSHVTSEQLLNGMIENVSFGGVTGQVQFARGDGGISNIRKGDREVGVHYMILSFNKRLYDISNVDLSCMAYVGHWSAEDHLQLCDSDSEAGAVGCYAISYNTQTGTHPSDALPPIIVELLPSLKGLITAMGVIVVLISVTLAVMVAFKHKTKLIKVSQPGMMMIMLFGGLMSAAKMIVAAQPVTTASCTAGLWLGHLAFCFGVCTLFMKSWRIDKIINTRTIKRVVVTEHGIVMRTLAISSIVMAYLLILTTVGRPHKAFVSSVTSNQETRYMRCGFRTPLIHTVMFALEAFCLLIGVRLCWATKDAPDVVNESKFIAQSIVFIAVISALVFPIVFILPLLPAVRQLISSLAFFAVTLVVFSLMFGPKVWSLFWETPKTSSELPVTVVKTVGNSASSSSESLEDKLKALAKQTLKNKARDDRPLLCQQQIALWQTMLLQINDHNSSTSGGSAGSGAVSTANNVNARKSSLAVSIDESDAGGGGGAGSSVAGDNDSMISGKTAMTYGGCPDDRPVPVSVSSPHYSRLTFKEQLVQLEELEDEHSECQA